MLAHKSLADYTHIVGRELIEEIRELAEPLKDRPRRPPVRDRVRWRRVRDPVHARPADARRRARGRVAGDLRARGVLQLHQAHAQRAAGQPAGPHGGAVGRLAGVQRDERARALARLGRLHRARSAARRAAHAGAREVARVGVALPHRHSEPNPPRSGVFCGPTSALRRGRVPRRRASCRRHSRRPRRDHAAGDRPAEPQEHGAGRRTTRPRAAVDWHRRSTAADDRQVSRFDPGRTRWA